MGINLKRLSLVASVMITAIATSSQVGANGVAFGFDTSFGSGGVVTHSLPVEASSTVAISGVIDSVGRFVSIVNFNVANGVPGYKLARLSGTGVLDETFGSGGLTQPEANIFGVSVVQLPEARGFVVAGIGANSTELRAFTADGLRRTTFGINGMVHLVEGGNVYLQLTASRIIVIRETMAGMSISSYDFDGNLDMTFGTQGVLSVRASVMFDEFEAVDAVVTDDGQVLVLGQVRLPPTEDQIRDPSLARTYGVVVLRHTSAGVLDTSFGGINPSPQGHLLIEGAPNELLLALKISAAENTAPADANNGKFMVLVSRGDENSNNLLRLLRFHENGNPDTGFGSSGIVNTQIQIDGRSVYAGLRMLPNGSTLIGIGTGFMNSISSAVIKLAPNGSFDTAFSDDGIFEALRDSNGRVNSVMSIVPGPTGSVVVVGVSGSNEPTTAIMRVNANGQPDATFGLNGVATAQINLLQPLYGWTNAYEQADGTWIVAGEVGSLEAGWLGDDDRIAVVARLGTNGQPDATFGVNGVVSVNLGDENTDLYAINVLPDGKILLLLRAVFQDTATVLVRLLPNGVLDSTFDGPTGNGNGVVRLTAGFYSSMGMTVDSVGRITVVGRQYDPDVSREIAVMQRFNSNGELDTNFDGASGIGNGTVTFPITDEHSFTSVLLDADGRYIVTGFNEGVTFVGRVRSDGVLDTTFGQLVSGTTRSGMTRIELSNGRGGSVSSQIDAVQILPDGALMIAGDIQTFDGPNEIRRVFAMRLLGNGSLDENFDGSTGGANGLYILPVNIAGLEDFATDMVVASDGTVLITGHSTTSDQSVVVEGWGLRQAFVVRINQLGVIDTSLATNGFQMFNGDYPTMMFRSIIASASGGWIVVGRAGGIWSEHGMISRLTSGAVPQSQMPTSPVPNVPEVVVPVADVAVTTPVKAVPKLIKPVVLRKKSVKLTTLMKYMELTMPKGSKVTITVSPKSKRFCALKKTSVVYVRPGKCSVQVSVKPKQGKSRSARTVMVVKK